MSNKLQLERGKTYETAAGNKFKIVHIENATGSYLGLSPDGTTRWFLKDGWCLNTFADHDHKDDLIKEYKRVIHHKVWVTAYNDGEIRIWRNLEESHFYHNPPVIATKCVDITLEEGEGL